MSAIECEDGNVAETAFEAAFGICLEIFHLQKTALSRRQTLWGQTAGQRRNKWQRLIQKDTITVGLKKIVRCSTFFVSWGCGRKYGSIPPQ
jgi:hypothetical protein